MARTLEERDWKLLLNRIKDGRCTPFLGAGACFGTLPLGSEIAQDWAIEYNYPFEDKTDLIRVAQYVAIEGGDAMTPKHDIAQRILKCGQPNYNALDEAHGFLADLPLPVYITTNYDSFMVKALENRHKRPKQEICRWNKYIREQELDSASFIPNPNNPLVFHLHGEAGIEESLVLTEDDYLDFLVNTSRDPELIPYRVQQALTGATILFIGYKIADWNFRVLFRGLNSYLEKAIVRANFSVQIFPLGDETSSEQKDRGQKYLDSYYGGLNTRVYWGTSKEFITELRRRWEDYKNG